MILFSFIIPTYNRSYCITDTIKSILSQQFSSFEIVVVDDASTDNTTQVVNAISETTPKIKYIKLDKNKGTNIAKNIGAGHANGQYLVFLDSDDELLNDSSLDKMNKIILDNNAPGILMFACKDLDGNITNKNPNLNGLVSFVDYFKGKAKGEYLPVIKTTAFQEIKFYEDINGGEGLTWQKITKRQDYIYISSETVRLYNNKNNDRLSFKNKKYYFRLSKIFIKDLKVNFTDYFYTYWLGLFSVLIKILYYKILSFKYFIN